MEKASAKIGNVAFYTFVEVGDPDLLRTQILETCKNLSLKGTILLATEGLNGMLAGAHPKTIEFTRWLTKDPRFSGIHFKWSFSDSIPFKRLLVKVKREILTLRQPSSGSKNKTAPYVTAEEFREILKQDDGTTFIDVRNHFEVEYGTFRGAIDPQTKSFGEFPTFIEKKLDLSKDKKIITFCTGGIRCEKATELLLQAGYKNVFQLKGGILEYLGRTSGEFFEGSCFVFDEREALDKNLKSIKNKTKLKE